MSEIRCTYWVFEAIEKRKVQGFLTRLISQGRWQDKTKLESSWDIYFLSRIIIIEWKIDWTNILSKKIITMSASYGGKLWRFNVVRTIRYSYNCIHDHNKQLWTESKNKKVRHDKNYRHNTLIWWRARRDLHERWSSVGGNSGFKLWLYISWSKKNRSYWNTSLSWRLEGDVKFS